MIESGVEDVATKSDVEDVATKSDVEDVATKSDVEDVATPAVVEDPDVTGVAAITGVVEASSSEAAPLTVVTGGVSLVLMLSLGTGDGDCVLPSLHVARARMSETATGS